MAEFLTTLFVLYMKEERGMDTLAILNALLNFAHNKG